MGGTVCHTCSTPARESQPVNRSHALRFGGSGLLASLVECDFERRAAARAKPVASAAHGSTPPIRRPQRGYRNRASPAC